MSINLRNRIREFKETYTRFFCFGLKHKPVIDGMFTMLYSSLLAALHTRNQDLLAFSKTLNGNLFC